MISWWVALWDRRESPLMLAMIRIGLSVVMLFDLFWVAWYNLVVPIWGPMDAGGLTNVVSRKDMPWVYDVFPHVPETAIALYAVVMLSLVSFGAGLFTRSSGLLFVLTYSQMAHINDPADRGIDTLVRIMMLILICSQCGATASVDAKLKTGRWMGDGQLAPAWPRYLIICQLVLMYWCAGVEKFAVSWFPWGGYSALYIILQDPIFAHFDFGFLAHPLLYPFTQLSTAVSHIWEWTVPLLLLAYYYWDTSDRPGRLRALFNRAHVRLVYISIGAIFHLLLACSLRLGIFPAAMLAFYPAFFHPEEAKRAWARLMSALGRSDQDLNQPVTRAHQP